MSPVSCPEGQVRVEQAGCSGSGAAGTRIATCRVCARTTAPLTFFYPISTAATGTSPTTGIFAPFDGQSVYLPLAGESRPSSSSRGSNMGKKKTGVGPPATAQYRLSLERAVVAALRVRAARLTLSEGRSITWAGLLREAAKQAAEGGVK
jgi:hypothetical protein